MRLSHATKSLVFALTGWGLLAAQVPVMAAPPAEAPSAKSAPAAEITDIALASGGTLRGQVVDGQGVPQAKSAVTVSQKGQKVSAVRTDADGRFAVAGLKGGVYTVATTQGAGAVRLWTADAAPPAAHQQLLVVNGSPVARGQLGGGIGAGVLMVGALGGIVAGGVISQENAYGS